MYQWNFFVFNACDVNDSYWIVYVYMWNWMFESSVIITGGKQRSDINTTYALRDGAITLSRSVVAARESLSGVFQGSLEAYSPGACSQVSRRSDILEADITWQWEVSQVTQQESLSGATGENPLLM